MRRMNDIYLTEGSASHKSGTALHWGGDLQSPVHNPNVREIHDKVESGGCSVQ